MAIVIGTHVFGRVENHDGSRDATHFVHVCHFPLIPVGSAQADRPLSWRSVGIGYARVWGLLGLVIGFFVLLDALTNAVTPGAVVAATLPMTLLGWFVAAVWIVAGRPRAWEAGMRRRALLALGVLVPLGLFALFTTLGIRSIPQNKAQLAARR
jgi:hypothetical protein